MSQKEAINLLDRYLKGTCSEQEKRKVETWLEGRYNGNNEWDVLPEEERIKYVSQIFKDLRERIEPKMDERKPKSRKSWYWAAAATFVLAATYALLYLTVFKGDQTSQAIAVQNYTSISTGIGEVKEVILKDGTRVWLNAMSTLRYPAFFEGNTREVIIKGEAFFEVAKNEDKPFIVHSGVLHTQALGTSFNVKAYPADTDIEITVVSGKVAVRGGNTKEDNGVELEKNECLNFVKKNAVITKEERAGASDYMAWTKGEMVFYHTSMKKVAKALHRAFGLNIHFADPKIEDCEISGQFEQKQEVESILKAICLSIGAQYDKHGTQITIEGSGCN